jgi:Holliday junction resolvase
LRTKDKALTFSIFVLILLQTTANVVPLWSRFGREGEFVVTIYLRSKGWGIQLSKGSRGPADIIATKMSTKWLIQVKSSTKIPRLKGYEVKRLVELSRVVSGSAVIATLQPTETARSILTSVEEKDNIDFFTEPKKGIPINLGNYVILFYSLPDWTILTP